MANATNTCGCCTGTQRLTPQTRANRPGLGVLTYRVGTQATFLETMLAQLSSLALAVPAAAPNQNGQPKIQWLHPLDNLTTRALDDPAIALLDAWATVADVLTFYQERIANEGYLRTATERRSVLELARLIGYTLRPGVAATAWLALELDKDYEVTIQPYELKAQSVPGPGELPQTFENTESLAARHAWNRLQPRLAQPQTITTLQSQQRLYLKGISTNLKPNDVLLITVGDRPAAVYRVAEVKPDTLNDRTLITFQTTPASSLTQRAAKVALDQLAAIIQRRSSPDEREKLKPSAETGVTSEFVSLFDELDRRVRVSYSSAESAEFAIREVLTKMAALEDGAEPEPLRYRAELTKELETPVRSIREAAAREKARAFAEAVLPAGGVVFLGDPLKKVMGGLTKPPSIPPRNALSVPRNVATTFATCADTGLQLAATFATDLHESLPVTLANVKVTPDSNLRVYVFRAVARPFGYNAPPRPMLHDGDTKYTTYQEWRIDQPFGNQVSGPTTATDQNVANQQPADVFHHQTDRLYLDSEYKIQSSGWVLVERPWFSPTQPLFFNLAKGEAKAVQLSLAAYGVSGKATCLQLEGKSWLTNISTSFTPVRQTVVYCESEELPLADEPITASICGGDTEVELDNLYSGLQAGRWLVVAGERDDIVDETGSKVRGVNAAELVMLAEVNHKVNWQLAAGYYNYYGPVGLPGDQTHTFIKLANPLQYCYRRDTAIIYGNVVKATHGETRKETLGSGDGSQVFQSFSLKQPPLTFVASPTPAGADSTLKVYVNDVQWREMDNFYELGATDHRFITKTDDDGKTTVVFGDGHHGARLPTSVENIRAQYRNGIGKAGNVRAEQISQLTSKPLGIKGVINPRRASGGADRESRDTARQNAPLTVTALDRLVSVSDYADFARTFAGIGKATATRITDGRREWVHVTIAGADDIPIDETSDLYRNLLQSLHDYGDPYQAVALQVREQLLLVISAQVRILADYPWEPVAKAIRTKLLETFSFERYELGQDVLLSTVIGTIQSVRGVAYVDVDVLGGVPEKKTEKNAAGKPIRRLLTPEEIAATVANFLERNKSLSQPHPRVPVNLADFEDGAMRPAQLAYLTPTVADTLILNQIR